jgi:hypothetical protein
LNGQWLNLSRLGTPKLNLTVNGELNLSRELLGISFGVDDVKQPSPATQVSLLASDVGRFLAVAQNRNAALNQLAHSPNQRFKFVSWGAGRGTVDEGNDFCLSLEESGNPIVRLAVDPFGQRFNCDYLPTVFGELLQQFQGAVKPRYAGRDDDDLVGAQTNAQFATFNFPVPLQDELVTEVKVVVVSDEGSDQSEKLLVEVFAEGAVFRVVNAPSAADGVQNEDVSDGATLTEHESCPGKQVVDKMPIPPIGLMVKEGWREIALPCASKTVKAQVLAYIVNSQDELPLSHPPLVFHAGVPTACPKHLAQNPPPKLSRH